MRKLITGLGLGWLAAWFLDPQRGHSRRALTRDRWLGRLRRLRRRAERFGRGVGAHAYGLVQRATHLRERSKGDVDDVTLARKVETEIFRPADVPKGRINVNAENGKIVLRGELDSFELIERLVEQTRKVHGVKAVESLLHTPRESAPMHD